METHQTRVLFISPRPPLPMVSGDTIRVFHVLQQLRQHGWLVDAFFLQNDEIDRIDLAQDFDKLTDRWTLHRLRKSPIISRLKLLGNIAKGKAFQEDVWWDKHAQVALHDFIVGRQYDIVLVSFIHCMAYIPAHLIPITILDSHNAEYLRMQAFASGGHSSPARRLLARVQMEAVKQFEAETVKEIAGTLAVSPTEFRFFESLAPGKTTLVPNGVDVTHYTPAGTASANEKMLFLGSLSYSANVDGLYYLVKEVLPLLTERAPYLTVAGSGATKQVDEIITSSTYPIDSVGYVDDTRDLWATHRFLLVPLRIGAGTRLKILEAMAAGVPVISTTIGCEGLDVVHERDIIIADNATELAGWIDRLKWDDELVNRLSLSGRRTVEKQYSWSQIGDIMDSSLKLILGRLMTDRKTDKK